MNRFRITSELIFNFAMGIRAVLLATCVASCCDIGSATERFTAEPIVTVSTTNDEHDASVLRTEPQDGDKTTKATILSVNWGDSTSEKSDIEFSPDHELAYFLMKTETGAALCTLNPYAESKEICFLHGVSVFNARLSLQPEKRSIWVFNETQATRVDIKTGETSSTIAYEQNTARPRAASVGDSVLLLRYQLGVQWKGLLFDLNNQSKKELKPIEGAIANVAASPKHGLYVVGNREDLHTPDYGGIKGVNAKTGETKWETKEQFPIRMFVDGDKILVANGSEQIRVFNTATGKHTATIEFPNGAWLLSLHKSGNDLYVYDAKSRKTLRSDGVYGFVKQLRPDTKLHHIKLRDPTARETFEWRAPTKAELDAASSKQ